MGLNGVTRWFRRRPSDDEMREELESHVAMRAEHDGTDEAAARRRLGNVLQTREMMRRVWIAELWDTVRQDARFTGRALSRSPGFAAAAVVTVALGVGLNTGIFSVLNGVLFRGLPAPDAHELVSVYQTIEGGADRTGQDFLGFFSTSEYRTYRDGTRTLSGILGHTEPWEATLGGEAPQDVNGLLVTCNYFDVLGQPPVIGRGPTADECDAGADPVVVLGHELWATTFGTDRAIVGRTVDLNRQQLTVVGIASEGTYGGFLYNAAFFAPISAQPFLRPDQNIYENDQNSSLALVGRRQADVTLDRVRAELSVIAARIDQQEPGRSTTVIVERATPLVPPLLHGAALGAGAVVMTAFGLVLLLACANVANLLLARATARSREIAVRLSLGASRARVVRQLLTESVLISSAGGLLGSVLALWSFQALVAFALPSFTPAGIPPPALDSSPDVRVLSFALALAFGTGILFGLAPALHVSKPELHSMMKHDSPGVGRSRRGSRLQGTLVGVQVTVCMVLMIGAGLLLRGLYATQTVDPGFAYRDVAYASYDLESAGYSPDEAAVFQRRLKDLANALPGVDASAYAVREPLSSGRTQATIRLPGQDRNEVQRAELNAVTPAYFSLIGIPIVRGRTFTDAELANDATVTIVSETTAGNYWPGQDPVGQTLLQRTGPDQEISLQVIGVARDAQVTLLGQIDPYYVYLPATPRWGDLELLFRSRSDFGSTASGIRAAVRALDPGVAVRVSPLEANLEYWRNLSGSVTALAASLGLLALVLASVGIYGVVSYFVNRRFREIGIRMALGARSSDVLGLILRQTMRPVVAGALIGVAAAVAASRILSSVLFGVSPVDPIALGGGAVLVLCVALAAGLLAWRRGTRADPARTLHCE